MVTWSVTFPKNAVVKLPLPSVTNRPAEQLFLVPIETISNQAGLLQTVGGGGGWPTRPQLM